MVTPHHVSHVVTQFIGLESDSGYNSCGHMSVVYIIEAH